MRREWYVFWAVIFIGLTGCPTYEDEFSGRYRENPTAERITCFERRECGLLEVDFFRFGDFSQAIVREFDRGPRNTAANPFVELTRCYWTRTDRFREDSFNLAFERRTGGIRGITNDSEMNLEFIDSESTFDLELTEEEPRPDCATVGDYSMAVTYEGQLEAEHQIENPVFVMLWLGLERVDTPGGTVYTGTQGFSTFLRLPSASVNASGTSLSGRVDLIQITPPDERFLSQSGETSYAIGHFVIVDDSPGESGRFTWARSEEPIIATTIEAGAEGWDLSSAYSGKALLFVQGSLLELDPALQERIVNLDGYEYMDQNFFIVDVVADGRDIVEIKLPERRIPEWPRLRATDEFLDQPEINLPRLFPFNSL